MIQQSNTQSRVHDHRLSSESDVIQKLESVASESSNSSVTSAASSCRPVSWTGAMMTILSWDKNQLRTWKQRSRSHWAALHSSTYCEKKIFSNNNQQNPTFCMCSGWSVAMYTTAVSILICWWCCYIIIIIIIVGCVALTEREWRRSTSRCCQWQLWVMCWNSSYRRIYGKKFKHVLWIYDKLPSSGMLQSTPTLILKCYDQQIKGGKPNLVTVVVTGQWQKV